MLYNIDAAQRLTLRPALRMRCLKMLGHLPEPRGTFHWTSAPSSCPVEVLTITGSLGQVAALSRKPTTKASWHNPCLS